MFARGSLIVLFAALALAQPQEPPLTNDQIIDKAAPSVAVILASRTPLPNQAALLGAAITIRPNGVLLTAYHLVKDAYAIQVRFKGGDIFDRVQLLGFDARRDVAAIRITAAALPVLPVAVASAAKSGDSVAVLSHPAGLPWSASTGVVSALRLADEIPGAGKGYRLIQFTAASSPGSSGGVLLDSRGAALGLVVGSLLSGQNLNFAVPLDSVLGLADAPISRNYALGTTLELTAETNAVRQTVPPGNPPRLEPGVPPAVSPAIANSGASPDAPEKSELLKNSKDKDFILRNFRTMFVDARRAQYFGSDQLKAELGRNKDFAKLNIRIVDDRNVADVVLDVGYTFAWDYPFQLKHQNTTMVLLSGKGVGPFSGIIGAADVASEFVKAATPYRVPPTAKK